MSSLGSGYYGGGHPGGLFGTPITTTADVNSDPALLKRIDNIEKIIEGIAKRLSILDNPDPKKLAQYKMLKEAYTKYIFLEKLCAEENSES